MVHFAAVAAFTTMRYLQRECPACGNIQIAPMSKIREAVRCNDCNCRIPPGEAMRHGLGGSIWTQHT
jgi:hypothetical protein